MPDLPILRRWLKKAATLPPRQTLLLARTRLSGIASRGRARARDQSSSTYIHPSETPPALIRRARLPTHEVLVHATETLVSGANSAIRHEFDLLGSGATVVRYGTVCLGLEGVWFPPETQPAVDSDGRWLVGRLPKGSLDPARLTWGLVDPGYVPIDWQLDFKSGYRWSERSWSADIPFGKVRGADVKVPWELARMQHLPRLALAAAVAQSPAEADAYRRECRNELLDFISTNPPRFGVNWATTMEVALRVVNWLVAWDLLIEGGAAFDDAFERVFRRSVLDHGRHIASNLEWSPVGRGNHYLADIVGLLFVAAWLPASGETDQWFALAKAELVNEASRQLQEDGSIFEASTCYHRLSVEMLAWAVGLISAVEGEAAIPSWLIERLGRAAEFTIDMTKPSGRVAQIGDNDNGRFVSVIPAAPLDHRHLPVLIKTLLGDHDAEASGLEWAIEGQVLRQLAGPISRTKGDGRHRAESVLIGDSTRHAEFAAWHSMLTTDRRAQLKVDLGHGARERLRTLAYPDFGYYILRSDRVFLGIRAGSVGQDGVGGHAHNDQLSIELTVDGKDWIADPGSYLYTPFPEYRNAYRSIKAHATPRADDREPARLDRGLWELGNPAIATCLVFGDDGFIGELRVHNQLVRLRAQLKDDHINLEYGFDGDLESSPVHAADWRDLIPNVAFSPGYGMVDRAK